MATQLTTVRSSFVYHRMPTNVSRQDFHRSIDPHLKRPKTGPAPTLALDNIFHDLLSGLHTGIQGDQLTTRRHELHDPHVYKWPNRWAQEGSYQTRFHAAMI